ncbi:MAG: DUF3320 domain-containing protein [Halobacteriales archaeon]
MEVERHLREARRNLLDTSLRNKLLNYRETRRSSLEVVDELPEEVYRRLVVDGRPMRFRPSEQRPEQARIATGDGEPGVDALPGVEEGVEVRTIEDDAHVCLLCEEDHVYRDTRELFQHIQEMHGAALDITDRDVVESGVARDELSEPLRHLPAVDDLKTERQVDRKLQTPHAEDELETRLYHVSNKSDALVRDAGYNALYLALGFLEWKPEDHDVVRAPLVLVPVSLERDGVGGSYEVEWTEDEVTGNPALDIKLQDEGFELPEFTPPERHHDVRTYLETVDQRAKDRDDWQVTPDVRLGFFDFTRYEMYRDLDPERWEDARPPERHPVLPALLGEDEADEPEGVDAGELDDLSPEDVHHVLDADPSQAAAIEDVRRGRDLVIEGPPGTGKSQTIVNMIAALLADGKSVLFVSEKLAALEVVRGRLDDVGLGDFCLELHSHRANKAEFLEELERLANLEAYDADDPSEEFERLERLRDRLREYVDALAEPYGDVGWTPYEMMETVVDARRRFRGTESGLPHLDLAVDADTSRDVYVEAREAVERLADLYRAVEPLGDNPWRHTEPGRVLPRDRREIAETLDEARQAGVRLRAAVQELRRTCHASVETPVEVERATEAIESLEGGYDVDPAVLDERWDTVSEEASRLVELVDRHRRYRNDVRERVHPDAVDVEPADIIDEHERHTGLKRFLRPSYYAHRRRLNALYDGDVPSDDVVGEHLRALVEHDSLVSTIEASRETGARYFDDVWRGTDSDVDELRGFADWATSVREAIRDAPLEPEATSLAVAGGLGERERDAVESARERLREYETAMTALSDVLDVDEHRAYGASLRSARVEDVCGYVERLAERVDELEEYSRYRETARELREGHAESLVDVVERDALDAEDFVTCYDANVADSLLDSALRDRAVLAEFDSETHERTIADYREADLASLELNRERVFESLVDSAPRLMQGSSKSSEAGVLFHEFGKKRRHKPIRVLLDEAGDLVKRMKPCFMMSPHSVAKYVEPGSMEFDVVVFDEASQVRPEDALGAVMRGSQVVLLGDTNQLPPTSFFDRVVDDRDPDDYEFSVPDVESVLDLGRSALPSKRLRWHYRSRHESLIEVSNEEFYDGDLRVYPTADRDTDSLGVEHRHLPDAAYDRGGTRVNRDEARAVAEDVFEHLEREPGRSVGVGTFSKSQAEAVRREVERLRQENPELDHHFTDDVTEPVFVKNLERIQGDERDVVLVSVGYGYDEDGGFSHNFGPLNDDGGWRRLNVLVTRARERCVVYSNFTSRAIDLEATSSRGVRAFKRYLEHAESGGGDREMASAGDADTAFERAVVEALLKEGYDVHLDVGCEGLTVDVAVVHPEEPEEYAAAVLLDDESYQSEEVTRARDRQRLQVLEDRGWHVHRSWSTEWHREPRRARERLLAAVNEAVDDVQTDTSPEAVEDTVDLPSVDDLQAEHPELDLDDLADAYVEADYRMVFLGDHEPLEVVEDVERVVETEGPIHYDHLCRRLVDMSDVDRLGERIEHTIGVALTAADVTERSYDGERFVYPADVEPEEVVVRRRDEDVPVEWIPPEEVRDAVERLLDVQYATGEDDLVRQVAYVLGFQRTGPKIDEAVRAEVDALVGDEALRRVDGRVEIAGDDGDEASEDDAGDGDHPETEADSRADGADERQTGDGDVAEAEVQADDGDEPQSGDGVADEDGAKRQSAEHLGD